MPDFIYSMIPLLAIVIHLIINFDMLPGRKKVTSFHCAREYRDFLGALLYFYVTDALWGIFAGLGWTKVLYLDTASFYIAIAVSVLMMCHFINACLGIRGWRAKILTWFGYALLGLYVVLLIANVFNSRLFFFDLEGKYVAGLIRQLLFYPLVAASVLMAANAFVKAIVNQDATMRKRYIVVSVFCLTLAVAVVFQIIWPIWPFYALGCLIGNCFIHVFLIEDERAELRQSVIAHEQKMKHMAESEKARSMFFSTGSHDIRTPLSADVEEQKKFAERGFTGVLLKPLTIDILSKFFS